MQGHLWYPLPQDTAQHKARAIPRPPEGGLTSDGQFRHCDQSAHPSARSALHPVARDAAVNATSEGMSMKAMVKVLVGVAVTFMLTVQPAWAQLSGSTSNTTG